MIKLNSEHKIISTLLLSALLFGAASGINIISLPFVLYQKSTPAFLIGISSATEVIAGIISARFLYRFRKKYSLLKLISKFAVINAVVILIIPFYKNFFIWLILIFLSGMSWFCMITLRQSWINGLIDDSKRSRILGLTSSFMCVGLTIGPLIVKFFGVGNYLNFLTSASLILSSFLILTLIKNSQPEIEKKAPENKIFNIIKKNYPIFLGRFLLDFQNIILIIFSVSYGIKHDFSAENSALLVSAFMAIGIFDFLIGFIIKKNFYYYLKAGFIGCLITIIILPLAMKNFNLAIMIYLIYGWFSSLIFVTAISAANNNQKKEDVVLVNSALQASGSSGSFVGILFAGILIELLGKHGFIISIASSSLIFLIINFFIKTKDEKNSFRS